MTPEIPEMTCAACRELLPWQTADSLTSAERAAVERHLAGCAECQHEVRLWSDIALALADAERTIPPDGGADSGWQALRNHLEPRVPMVVAQRRSSTPLAEAALTAAASDAGAPRRFSRPTLAAPAVVILVALIAALFVGFGSRLRQARTPAVSATSLIVARRGRRSWPTSASPDGAVIPSLAVATSRKLTKYNISTPKAP